MTKKQFIIGALLIALLHIGLVICFGIQKQGFHEDEYYTYWSVSSNSESLVPSNMSWHSGQELQSRFFVRAGERFSFDRVIQNQAEDVHPPLYYLALHVFMSLFANHFYKWFGILLNLLFSLITYVGILLVFLQIQGENARYRRELSLFAGFIYSILPSVISAVMLTRMYAMSTMWTAAYTLVFVLLFRYQDCGKKQFAGLVLSGAFICYCAFLTHYYALFVPFFLTVFYVLYTLIRRKGIVRMLVYGICMLVAISQAVLTYPACLSHIFGGYRGRDAISGQDSSLCRLDKQQRFCRLDVPMPDWIFIMRSSGSYLFCRREKGAGGEEICLSDVFHRGKLSVQLFCADKAGADGRGGCQPVFLSGGKSGDSLYGVYGDCGGDGIAGKVSVPDREKTLAGACSGTGGSGTVSRPAYLSAGKGAFPV